MSFQDKPLGCRDCGQESTFAAGEQEFYQQRGLMNEPGRCPDCRRARKSQQGGGGYGGGYSSGGGYERAPRQMYAAVCSQCRSEEHTSELQSRQYLVCRLLLEKKKKKNIAE